jgi:uncharacterized phage infection (PIP) family protein YhgE
MFGIFQYLQILGPSAKHVAKVLQSGAIAATDNLVSNLSTKKESQSLDPSRITNETSKASKAANYFQKVSSRFKARKKHKEIEKIQKGILKLESEIQNLQSSLKKLSENESHTPVNVTCLMQSSIDERCQDLKDLQEKLEDLRSATC